LIFGGLSTVYTPSRKFLKLLEDPNDEVRKLTLILLAQGLAYQHIEKTLVIAAETIGIDARVVADECVRQLNEMQSLERH
jgi:hypothetical protein